MPKILAFLLCNLLLALPRVCTAQIELNGVPLPSQEMEFFRAFGKPDSVNARENEMEGRVLQDWYHGSIFDVYESLDSGAGPREITIADLRLDKSPSWNVSIFGQALSSRTTFAAAVKLLRKHITGKKKHSSI
ncbi:MAG: hypothetical protein JO053_14770, partial [Acidobacteria bacterium]|nr:hypothetical protein [Acidobacteriota bacterium]